MSDLIRFGISAEGELLEGFDRLAAERGYGNRSEALRDLMRDALVQSRLEKHPGETEVLGNVTIMYDHHARHLTDRMAELQHARHGLVVSVLHVHLSHDDCMEVIVLRGQAGDVKTLGHQLLSLKGVKHGQLFITLPGRQITGQARPHKHRHANPKHTHTGPAPKV